MAQESCNLDKDEAEILKPSSSSSPSPPSPTTPPPPPAQTPSPPAPQPQAPTPFVPKPREESPLEAPEKPAIAAAPSPSLPVFGNRCNVCCKKVGLTGFRCRCGELFCPRHRYSETHDCSFDYKAAGREEIARANPVIRAAKIIKI